MTTNIWRNNEYAYLQWATGCCRGPSKVLTSAKVKVVCAQCEHCVGTLPQSKGYKLGKTEPLQCNAPEHVITNYITGEVHSVNCFNHNQQGDCGQYKAKSSDGVRNL